MFGMLTLTVSLVIVPTLLFLALRLFRSGRREQFLPPGPPTYPVLGNLLSLPSKGFYFKFTEWGKQYGDVYSLKLGSTTTIVLNSVEAIQDVIEKNSASTSDRPPIYVADLVTGERQPYLLFTHYSSEWRSQRRAVHEMLRAQACPNYVPIQRAEVYQFAMELLTNPERFMKHVHRLTLSSITSSMFGFRVPSSTSSFYIEFYDLIESWLPLVRPGSQVPVDIFPILNYIPWPLVTWKETAKRLGKKQRTFSCDLLESVEKRVANGQGNECFMEVLLRNGETWGLDREFVAQLGVVLLDGTADTSSNTIETFIMFMTANPEMQKRAQQEIDDVVGMDRMPNLEDIHDLPYVAAAILETSRMRPVIPNGVPHYTTNPIKYKGYLIPKDSTLILNMWGIFHDEKMFPDPETYNPERFLNNSEAQRTMDYLFGAGRRVCPGLHFGKNILYLTIMTLLWGFNISKSRDASGNEIEVDIHAFEERIAIEPKPFKCDIKPRSAKRIEMLRSEFHASERDIHIFESKLSDVDAEYLKSLRGV